MASTSAPITFNGSSTFSSSFQQVLTRAVQIASLPVQQMQNKVSDLSYEQAVLSSLEGSFLNLQNALLNLESEVRGSLSATVSDPSIVSATAASNALPGIYTIEVANLGSSTTTLSQAGLTKVTDPTVDNITISSAFTLTVNGTAHTISPSGTSLESLAASINSAAAGVQATIVNVGSSSSPDYRLAIASSKLGAATIQLQDSGGANLLDTLQTGADAAYKVNGLNSEIQSDSRQVTLAPGLTVNLLQQSQSGQPVVITVGSNYSSLENGLSRFVSAYNSSVDALAQERGQNAGPLSGQSIILSLENTVHKVSQYTSLSGSISSLPDLGLTMDQNGHLSFDSSVFQNANPSDLQQFLGSATSGGFLKAANDALSAASDTSTGAIANAINATQAQITNENKLIAQEQARITDLQNNLQQQLSAADAAIATLQAQKSYFANLFAAEYLNNNPNSTTGGL